MDMKLSELKKQIKDNIYEILSEENNSIKEAGDPSTIEKVNKKIQNNPEFLKKTEDAINKAKQGNTDDLAIMMAQLLESDDEDREPTKDELEKEKVKGAPSKFKISNEKYKELKDTLKKVVEKVKDLDKKIKDPDTKKSELEDLKDQKLKKMETLKKFMKNDELVKAFKERDVKIDTDDLIG